MSKKLFLTLLIAMIISPLSFAQDDADAQEDTGMDEQTMMDETTDEETMHEETMHEEQTTMDEQPESAKEPVKGMIASTKYHCELQGMTRRVEINYEVPDSTVPCSVSYYKDTEVPGEVNTLWTANNVEGYCEERAAAFVDKLGSWGWSCQDN